MTNEELNAQRESDRLRAIREAQDRRVIPNSGYDPRDRRHTEFFADFDAAGGRR